MRDEAELAATESDESDPSTSEEPASGYRPGSTSRGSLRLVSAEEDVPGEESSSETANRSDVDRRW
jgi:hypothetical protein